MNIQVSYLCALSFMLSLVFTTAEAATISMQADTFDVSTNTTVVFSLAGNGFTDNVDGGDFTLAWNSTVLSYSGLNISNAQFDTVFIDDSNVASGTLDSVFLATSIFGGIGPDFAIGEITFEVIGSAGSTTTVSLNDALVGWVAPGAEPVSVNYTSAMVRVVPVPAALYLFASGFIALFSISGFNRRTDVVRFMNGKARALRAGFAWLLVFAAVVHVEAAEAPVGLDSRPVNTTCLAFDRPNTNASVELQQVFPSLPIAKVVLLTQPAGDSSYWYFARFDGIIGRFANTPGVSSWDTVLDLSEASGSGKVALASDGGFIQLVFHPNYPTDPRVFVNYSTTGTHGEDIDIIVSSFEMLPGGIVIDELSEVILITQPRGAFHQGGFMSFGLDGLLYLGLGDGTDQSDPTNRAQDLTDFRGSILRIDVDSVPFGEVYSIPPDNPYADNPRCGPVGNSSPCPEIFAPGFRNPFRGDIDSVTGDIWVGDVGFGSHEEIDKVIKGGNYGWNVYEGTLCVEYSGNCADTSLIEPVVEYSHADGQCAVIGGYVYRGNTISELQGRYLFADYCTSKVSAVQYDNDGNPFEEILLPGGSGIGQILTFARDSDGELYVVTGSKIYKIVDKSGGGDESAPATLSQTGCFVATEPTIPASGLIPYDLNSALWSDGAEKRRWMALAEGTTVNIDADGDFLFPAGTILVKEFAYDGVPHETRLLVHHLDGIWVGYSYEWRADGSDADLLPAGKVKVLPSGHTWTYPSRAECVRCHTDIANSSLGPELAQLNRQYIYPSSGVQANQLETLAHIGMFDAALPDSVGNLPKLPQIDDESQSVDLRARAYLHANCSMCHQPGGTGQGPEDFRYYVAGVDMGALNELPTQNDFGIVDARLLSPGHPEKSIISYRMHSLELGRMPPLGTAVVDQQGTDLIDRWIRSGLGFGVPDSDGDELADNLDNCILDANGPLMPDSGGNVQLDTDGDGFGNLCDPDFNNNGIVDVIDFSILKSVFASTAASEQDLNGNGVVDVFDFSKLKSLFGKAPGPSGLVP